MSILDILSEMIFPVFWDVAFGPIYLRMLCCSTTKESLIHEWQSIPTSDTHIHRLEDTESSYFYDIDDLVHVEN